jgi:hypothetical protein
MTLLLTVFTMVAFAGVYAGVLTMLGNSADAITSALFGRARQTDGGKALAASRRFSRA